MPLLDAAIEWALAAGVLAGTALGYLSAVNNHFPLMTPDVFNRVVKSGACWRIVCVFSAHFFFFFFSFS
jgi:hypothetical protein